MHMSYVCYTCSAIVEFPLTPPMPVVSSDHGHERGNFELKGLLLLELRLFT